MGGLSIWHWIIVLIIVALVFGTKKLRNVGEDLGAAVRSFKKGLNEETDEEKAQHQNTVVNTPAPVANQPATPVMNQAVEPAPAVTPATTTNQVTEKAE